MQSLRLAVVGTGALGRHHARILSGMDGVQLVGVADVNAASGQAVAEGCRTRWVADYRELLGEVDAVVVAVPTFAHREVAGECLERRISALVEKPIASNVAQAEELVALAEAHGTLLQVGHVERFNPAWTTAAKLVGDPLYIRSERFSTYAFRSMDIGVVHDVMIHDLDLVLSVVNAPVTEVEAFGTTLVGGHEDCVNARLTFENGCIADVCANRVSPVMRRAMQVWGVDGCTSIDFGTREVVHFAQSETLRHGSPLPARAQQPGADIDQMKKDLFGTYLRVERPDVPQADALTGELVEFVDCVRTGRRPQVTGQAALEAMRVADRVLQAMDAHRRQVFAKRSGSPSRKAA